MKYQFTYTYKDAVSVKKELANFLKNNYKDPLFFRFMKLIISGVFLLSSIAFIMDVHESSYKNKDLISHLCLICISVSLMFLIERFRALSKVKNYYATVEQVEMEILDDAMIVGRSIGCYTVVNFSSIKEIFQSYSSILIVIDELNSYYVPNHNFENIEAKLEFISILSDRIKCSKKTP